MNLQKLCFLLIAVLFPGSTGAQDAIGDWWLVPDYTLPGKANNYPGPRVQHPQSVHQLIEMQSTPVLFHGKPPTDRLTGLLRGDAIPREEFTLELWMMHHVHRPVGACMMIKGQTAKDAIPVTIGFHNWELHFTAQGQDGMGIQLKHRLAKWGGYKQRWVHLVVSYNGHHASMYVNGTEVANAHLHHDAIAWPAEPELEIASYMQNEPYMQLANLVHAARVYGTAVTKEQVGKRFETLCSCVQDGRLFPNLFHFTAGPYLNLSTRKSVNLVWETDRPSTAKIEWGTTANLGNVIQLKQTNRLHECTLSQMASDTPYFYKITCTNEAGNAIDSGLLTFKTAVEQEQPFRFAILGDTESRPHINDQLAKRIWAERPHFVVNLGDLTDAGKKPHRYEWTHEYFLGMNQLTSRVPMFAVPGNGESDLYWYNRYHNYPKPEGYYKFQYGNAEFFMLDSNQREHSFAPGGEQYQWLEEQLSACTAQWKFVCHHHATYTGEEDDYGDSWKEQQSFGDPFVRNIVPLYEKYNVDIAMFGHLHLYERSHPIRDGVVNPEAGTIHLLAGGGGGNLEDFAPTPAFFSAKTYPDHHYVTMEIVGDKLNMRMMGIDGALRDWLVLDKSTRKGALAISRVSDKDKPPTVVDQRP